MSCEVKRIETKLLDVMCLESPYLFCEKILAPIDFVNSQNFPRNQKLLNTWDSQAENF